MFRDSEQSQSHPIDIPKVDLIQQILEWVNNLKIPLLLFLLYVLQLSVEGILISKIQKNQNKFDMGPEL